MKQHDITISGRITDDGKVMLNMQELREFSRKWKNARIVATFRVYQPGTSEALKGYYFNYVVPTLKQAIWDAGDRQTDEQVERYLRKLSPVMWRQWADEEIGKYQQELREISDLDNSELIEHIETLKQIAAEEFNVFIEDPNTI